MQAMDALRAALIAGSASEAAHYAELARGFYFRAADAAARHIDDRWLGYTVDYLRYARSVAEQFHLPFDLARARKYIATAQIPQSLQYIRSAGWGGLNAGALSQFLASDRIAVEEFGAPSARENPEIRQLAEKLARTGK
jgi:hypothetical protein